MDGVTWPLQMVRNRWVTGVITSLMGVTTPSMTGRAHVVDLGRNERISLNSLLWNPNLEQDDSLTLVGKLVGKVFFFHKCC